MDEGGEHKVRAEHVGDGDVEDDGLSRLLKVDGDGLPGLLCVEEEGAELLEGEDQGRGLLGDLEGLELVGVDRDLRPQQRLVVRSALLVDDGADDEPVGVPVQRDLLDGPVQVLHRVQEDARPRHDHVGHRSRELHCRVIPLLVRDLALLLDPELALELEHDPRFHLVKDHDHPFHILV